MPTSSRTTDAAKAAMIAKAKSEAVAGPATQEPTGGLGWEKIEYDDALTLIEVFMWQSGARYSFGLNSEASGVFARVGVPKWSKVLEYQGKSAVCFASGLEHAIRKVAQLHNGDFEKWWKDDPYARG